VRAVERIAAGVAANREAQHLLPRLDQLPQFIIDNAKLRHLGDLPLLPGIGTGDTLAGAGVLDVAAAVPLEPPDVKGVVEKTGAAFGLAADRGVAPRAAVGARDAFGIEPLGDRSWALPVREFREDAADDGGLDVIDLSFAGRGGDEVIAVGLAARDLALQRSPKLAAPGLLLEVGEIELRHGAEHADVHRGDLADVDGDEDDAREGAAIVEIGNVGELASEAIKRFDDDHVEEAAIEVGQQLLIARPEAAGAAHRRVGVVVDRGPAALRDVAGADLDLVGDRGGALVLAAEPRIDCRAHHRVS